MEAALAIDCATLEQATNAEPEPEPEEECTGLPVGGLVSAGRQKIYIVKPALGLQGNGIELTTEPDKTAMVIEGAKGVVQVRPPIQFPLPLSLPEALICAHAHSIMSIRPC